MSGEKKHPASLKKRRKARADGDTGRSPILSGAVGLVAGITVLFSPLWALHGVLEFAQHCWAKTTDFSSGDMIFLLARVGNTALSALLPVALCVFAAVLLSELLQVGWRISFKPLAPKFERLNPMKGFGRMLGVPEEGGAARWPKGAVLELARGVFFLSVVSGVFAAVSLPCALFLPAAELERPVEIFRVLRVVAGWEAVSFGSVFLLSGALSLLFVRREREQRLMMSDEEVRRESKEDEGTPEQRMFRREIHQELLQAADEQRIRRSKVILVSSLRGR